MVNNDFKVMEEFILIAVCVRKGFEISTDITPKKVLTITYLYILFKMLFKLAKIQIRPKRTIRHVFEYDRHESSRFCKYFEARHTIPKRMKTIRLGNVRGGHQINREKPPLP
jgi:hypothetical protein